LLEVLKNKNDDVRRESVYALGEIQDPKAVPALIEAFRDKDSEVRSEAARSLIIFGSVAAPLLIKALNDEKYIVHKYASLVLGEIGDNSAVSGLSKVLFDKD
jgi:HEAT repeat protein